MLVSYVQIINVDEVHTFNLNDVTSPLNDFDITVGDRSDSKRYKPQMAGSWPTRSYDGEMTVHMEGALFADTSAAYMTKRKNLILALRGVPNTPVTDNYRGRIYFQPVGETELWYQWFGPTEFSSPIKGDYPSLTEFMLSLEFFDPWFIGVSTGNLYQLS